MIDGKELKRECEIEWGKGYENKDERLFETC